MKRQPISPKGKPESPKEGWQSARGYYTRHLYPPFRAKFDRSHWWEGNPQPEIEPEAALYELARRHPFVFAVKLGIIPHGWTKNTLPESLFFLSEYGLASWPELDAEFHLQDVWKRVAGIMKGVDCRDDSARCSSLECDALGEIALKRMFRAKKFQTKIMGQKTAREVYRLVQKDMVDQPPSAREVEAKIKRDAVEAYRAGYLLLAVAPHLRADAAERLMAQEFSQHRKRNPLPKQRARWDNWLALISEFENAEIGLQKAKSPLFTRYRRVLKSIRFT